MANHNMIPMPTRAARTESRISPCLPRLPDCCNITAFSRMDFLEASEGIILKSPRVSLKKLSIG